MYLAKYLGTIRGNPLAADVTPLVARSLRRVQPPASRRAKPESRNNLTALSSESFPVSRFACQAVCPWVTMYGIPPAAVVTTGVPDANASMMDPGRLSSQEAFMKNIRAAVHTAARSCPRKPDRRIPRRSVATRAPAYAETIHPAPCQPTGGAHPEIRPSLPQSHG